MAIVDHIRQDLKAKIKQQVFSAGDFLPTFQKLATTYNTSTNSVYRAIKQLGQENMVIAVKGAGTKVIYSPPEKLKEEASSKYAGLVIGELGKDAATMQLLTGIQTGLEKDGRNCIMKFSHKNQAEEHKVIMDLYEDGIRDIIIYPSFDHFNDLQERINKYHQMGINFTYINYFHSNLPVGVVCVDNYWGIYNLCDAMYKDGAKDFLYASYEIGEGSFDYAIHERSLAYREFIRVNKLSSKFIDFPFGIHTHDVIDDKYIKILSGHITKPGAAVVCMSNSLAMVINKALSQNDFAWPKDLYFGSFGNLDNFPHPYYEARVDFYDLGLELSKACITRATGKRIILDTNIIVSKNSINK
jgi:DNA-binding LacI/PurR family transcriptional regulator